MRKTVAAFCVAAVAALAPLSMSGEETVGPYVLIPDRVFDGESLHEGWVVVQSLKREFAPRLRLASSLDRVLRTRFFVSTGICQFGVRFISERNSARFPVGMRSQS